MKTKPQEAKKTAKTLKGQLFGALSMMLVASIALGTSTYAWFINNQTVEVQKMNLTVSTATSLQIAIHQKGGNTVTPYKNLIATADITGTEETQGKWANMFATADEYLLTPASIDNAGLASAAPTFYASNGHMNSTGTALDQFVAATVGEGNVKKLPLSFLSSSDLNVYFGKDSLTTIANLITAHAEAVAINNVNAAAQAAAIRTALRVAVVPKQGTVDGATTYTSAGTPVIFQFNDGDKNPSAAGQQSNTDYASVDISGLVYNEAQGKYIAVTGVNADTHVVTAAGQQTAQVPGTDIKTGANLYIVNVETDASTGQTTVTNYADNKALFDLKANKARDVDIYIWLEGTDGDCLSTLSQFTFDIALPFAGAPTTTVSRPSGA